MILLASPLVLSANLQISAVKYAKVTFLTLDCCLMEKYFVLDCHFGCQQCSGPRNGECSTCLPGIFHLSNFTGGYCFLVCPYGYKPDYTTYYCVTELANISKTVTRTFTAASPVTSTSFTIANAVSGSFSLNMMMCLVATESLANMQYLNINHSNIAASIYEAMSSSYIPNWIASFNEIDRELLVFPWGIFETNQISALFFDNFGDGLTEIMVHLGLFLFMAGITCTMQLGKLGESLAGRLYATVFSFFAANFFGKVQSLLLFSIMQILKMNLLFDSYSRMSLLLGYFTTSFAIGLLVFCFFRLQVIFNSKNSPNSKTKTGGVSETNTRMTRFTKSEASERVSSATHHQVQWLEKKYEFLFEDYKDTEKIHFFFAYYLTAFNAIYILLIFSLQTIPVLQCFSITLLALIFLIFPAIIKPFQKKVPAFLHFFNFSCIFLAATLNLGSAITQNLNPNFSGVEQQGKAVISIISINTIINTAISLGVMIFEIYQKCRSCCNDNTQELKTMKIEILPSTNKTTRHADLPKTSLKRRPRDSRSRRQKQKLSSSEANFSVERSFKIQRMANHSVVED